MSVARSSGVFSSLGTDETTGVTIANNASTSSSEVDMLGNDTSFGEIELFIKFTSTVAVGTVDVYLFGSRVTGQAYSDTPPLVYSKAPINGTQKLYIGRFPISRYMSAKVTNNATGANATNVTLGYELFKMS